MSFRKIFVGICTLLVIISSPLLPQKNQIEKIDSFIVKSMDDWKMPGFAVAVVKNDSVIFLRGYGFKDLRSSERVDENTLFMIASCSKAFTTAAIATLVDRKLVNWDDKVIKYLPDFHMYDPWVTNEITIRDLVTHRSGLETFSGDILWLGSNYDSKEVIRRAQYLKPTSSFRSKYGYQNIMYSVAGEVITAITDTLWSDFIKAHFFVPLNMNRSVTSLADMKVRGNYAQPHKIKNGKVEAYPEFYSIETVAPAGAIVSSVADMTNWIRLQLNKGKVGDKTVFSEKQSAEMWLNQTPVGTNNYGLGWFIRYWNGKKLFNHGGGMPGMISDVTLIPEEKIGTVILSNYETGMVTAVRNYILEVLINKEPQDWNKIMLENWKKREENFEKENLRREEVRVKNTKPSLELEKYTGLYEDKMYGKAEIRIEKEKLFMQFLPSPTMKGGLKHYHYDSFYIDWEDEFLTRGWIKFDMNFDASVKSFSIEVPNSPDFIFTELLFQKEK